MTTTSWFDQTNAFWSAWGDSQKQMMQEMLTHTHTPYTKQYAAMTNLWREMLTTGIEEQFGQSSPVARTVAEQIVSGQQGMTRFLDLSIEVWKSVMPQLEGDNPQEAFNSYMTGLRQRILDSSLQNMKASQNTAEMWNLYLTEMQKFGLPWLDFMQKVPQMPQGQDSMINLNNLFWDTYEQTLGRLMNMPSLGASRELNTLLTQNFDVWLDFRRVYTEYEILMAQTWFEAFEQLMAVTMERVKEGKTISTLKEYLNLWIEIADRAFTRFFGSDTYVEMQARLVNAGMAYKLRQRELTERVLNQLDIPTRSELDETHRRIHDLRREVRELKKELAAERKAKATSTGVKSNGAAPAKQPSAPAKATRRRKKPEGAQ